MQAVLNQLPDLSSNADRNSMAVTTPPPPPKAAAFQILITWIGIFIPDGGTASAILIDIHLMRDDVFTPHHMLTTSHHPYLCPPDVTTPITSTRDRIAARPPLRGHQAPIRWKRQTCIQTSPARDYIVNPDTEQRRDIGRGDVAQQHSTAQHSEREPGVSGWAGQRLGEGRGRGCNAAFGMHHETDIRSRKWP